MAVGPDVTVTVEVKLPVTNRTIYPVYNGEECDEGFFFFSQRQADSLAEDLEPQRKHLARLDDERIVLYTEMNPYENCPRNRWPDYKYLGHGRFYCHNGSWN
jgi:hypothetical protein